MVGGQRRDPQVQRSTHDWYLDASVLRDALLGDAHVGHDFETTDNGWLQSLRRVVHFLEHAVNAIADPQPFLKRLNMDIAGTVAVRFHDQKPDQLDDRSIGIIFRLVAGNQALRGRPRELDIDVAFSDFLQHVLDGFVCRSIVTIQRGRDLVFWRHNRFDIHFQDVAQAVDRINVERITDRHRQNAIVFIDRNNLVAARDVTGNQGKNIVGHLVVSQLDGVHAKLAGQRLGHIALGHLAHADQCRDDATVRLASLFFGVRDVFVADETDIPQDLDYKFILCRHLKHVFDFQQQGIRILLSPSLTVKRTHVAGGVMNNATLRVHVCGIPATPRGVHATAVLRRASGAPGIQGHEH